MNDALGCCGDARARIATGLTLISLMGSMVIGSTVGGRLMAKLAHYKRMGMIGLPLALASLVPISMIPCR